MNQRQIWAGKYWGCLRRFVLVHRIILSQGKFDFLVSGDVMSHREPRLADVISAEGVLDTLVDPRQPSWFLYGASRALALFTSSEYSVHPFLAYFFDGHTRFS